MKTSLLLSALLGASALLCAADEPAKTASSSPSPTAEAAKKAGFDEKVWTNPEFEEVKDVKKTTWKVADGKVPAGWYLQEAKKGAKEFSVLMQSQTGVSSDKVFSCNFDHSGIYLRLRY